MLFDRILCRSTPWCVLTCSPLSTADATPFRCAASLKRVGPSVRIRSETPRPRPLGPWGGKAEDPTGDARRFKSERASGKKEKNRRRPRAATSTVSPGLALQARPPLHVGRGRAGTRQAATPHDARLPASIRAPRCHAGLAQEQVASANRAYPGATRRQGHPPHRGGTARRGHAHVAAVYPATTTTSSHTLTLASGAAQHTGVHGRPKLPSRRPERTKAGATLPPALSPRGDRGRGAAAPPVPPCRAGIFHFFPRPLRWRFRNFATPRAPGQNWRLLQFSTRATSSRERAAAAASRRQRVQSRPRR